MSSKRPWTTACYKKRRHVHADPRRGRTVTAQFLKAGFYVAGAGRAVYSDKYFPCRWTEYQKPSSPCKYDRFMYISINPGPDAPQWVYEQGVPKVLTDDEKHLGKWKHYPYYLDAEYKRLFFRMIRSLAEHLKRLPAEQHRRIAFIQVKTGCTGDECPVQRRGARPQARDRQGFARMASLPPGDVCLVRRSVPVGSRSPNRIAVQRRRRRGRRGRGRRLRRGMGLDHQPRPRERSASRTGRSREVIICAANGCCTSNGSVTW